MPGINPDHLFEQADALISGRQGRPREADLRRAVSAAYYGMFHAISNAAAEYVVTRAEQGTVNYALVYRSVDHRRLSSLCKELQKRPLLSRFKSYEPPNGFSSQLRFLCSAVDELQNQRHAADYDPSTTMSKSGARLAINTARSAIAGFHNAPTDERTVFLLLVLFQPR